MLARAALRMPGSNAPIAAFSGRTSILPEDSAHHPSLIDLGTRATGQCNPMTELSTAERSNALYVTAAGAAWG